MDTNSLSYSISLSLTHTHTHTHTHNPSNQITYDLKNEHTDQKVKFK